MAYAIEFSEDAERHLRCLRAHDRNIVLDTIEEQLAHQPTTPTRHRKLLRPKLLSVWELRVGDWRVFYNVEEKHMVVLVVTVSVKSHNVLLIAGEEYTL
jgi:addiction module RelE/StbE family toxin